MEIKVNIPKNDYVQPIEVRQEVVQALCEAFLTTSGWKVFHPFSGSNNGCRPANMYISLQSPSFSNRHNTKGCVRIRGCEVNAAFKALRKAGYHMYQVYEYGSWMGYIWGGWTRGFKLNSLLNIDVVYGKDESYSVVSNT